MLAVKRVAGSGACPSGGPSGGGGRSSGIGSPEPSGFGGGAGGGVVSPCPVGSGGGGVVSPVGVGPAGFGGGLATVEGIPNAHTDVAENATNAKLKLNLRNNFQPSMVPLSVVRVPGHTS